MVVPTFAFSTDYLFHEMGPTITHYIVVKNIYRYLYYISVRKFVVVK